MRSGWMMLLTGCMPTISTNDLSVDHVSWDEVQGHVSVEANNPWPIDITVDRYFLQAVVDGQVLATAERVTPLTVPANDSRLVEVPVRIDTAQALSAWTSASPTWTRPIQLVGNVGFGTPFGTLDVPVSVDGQLPVLAVPSIRAPSLSIQSVSVWDGTIDLTLGFAVANPNAVELRAHDVKYGVSFVDEPFIQGGQAQIDIRANQSTRMSFPVHIDVGAVGRGALRAWEQRRVAGDVSLQGWVETPWSPLPLDLRYGGDLSWGA